jgi:hypothetical protein
MRTATLSALCAIVGLAACVTLVARAGAQTPPPPPLPAGSADAATAPQPMTSADPDLEPQVTIVRQAGETREEVRIGGQLKFVRVTPSHGRTYYLIPQGDGTSFVRRSSLDPQLSVPMWVLFSW